MHACCSISRPFWTKIHFRRGRFTTHHKAPPHSGHQEGSGSPHLGASSGLPHGWLVLQLLLRADDTSTIYLEVTTFGTHRHMVERSTRFQLWGGPAECTYPKEQGLKQNWGFPVSLPSFSLRVLPFGAAAIHRRDATDPSFRTKLGPIPSQRAPLVAENNTRNSPVL